MTTITVSDELVVLTCWCGMNHAVPSALRDFQMRQHNNGGEVTSIYCPLGHSHAPAGKGRYEREHQLRQQAEAALRSEQDQHQAERKAHATTKAKLTKARKRADNGVCQHCHRSFVNLAAHVRTKHPEEVA